MPCAPTALERSRMSHRRKNNHREFACAARAFTWGILLLLLAACSEFDGPSDIDKCKDFMDVPLWDEAIAICPTDTDEGKSLGGQARLGRAGVSFLDLLDGLSSSSLGGEALIFDLFAIAVSSSEFTDVEDAVNLFLSISSDADTGVSNRTDSDNFNLTIATDVLLISLLKEHLSISIDSTTGEFSVPGITDTGIDTISSTSSATDIQTVFTNIYTNNSTGSGSYYTTTPLLWDVSSANTDLSRISTYVAANAAGAGALGDGGLSGDPALTSLSALDFSVKIDNGNCGYSSGTTIDVDTVVLKFPRRLNTSDSTADYLADELLFVNGDSLEWQGSFPLPSALVNPDFIGVDCGAGLSVGAFGTCMGSAVLFANFTSVTESDLTTTITCGGSCTSFPVLSTDGNSAGADEVSGEGAKAKSDLSAVLDQLYPIDNTVTAPTGTNPAYACGAGDGLVHYREYDAYLRTLGQ